MTTTKRIGIDARFMGDAGPGRYVKNIVEHLEKLDKTNEYIIFLSKKGFDMYEPNNKNYKKVLADYTWYSFEEQLKFLYVVYKNKLDLFYVPHFNIPILYFKKLVTAIPDLIMHTYSTERGTTLPKPYFRLKKIIYKLVVFWAVFRSIKIIVPSNDVLNDFKKYFPFKDKSKYALAYEGVDPVYLNKDIDVSKVLTDFNIQKPFLLYVSSMYEHKNVPTLLNAFKILKEKYKYEGNLVLVGKKDKFLNTIIELINKLGLEENVIVPSSQRYISDQEVLALRKLADAYIFPSLKEGFSLTPLEAQAVGLSCIISDIPCHREIYGDSVLYFDPLDPEHIALKVDTLTKSPKLKQELIERGYQNFEKYNWTDTAQITLNVFEEILN